MNGRHEDVVSVRRGVERIKIGRLPEVRDGEGGGIDESELRKREVIEKVLVARTAKRVASFVGTALAFFSGGFLDTGTGKFICLFRCAIVRVRHKLDEKRFLIGHPLHFFVEHGVEMDIGNLFHAAGTRVANPELDRIGSDVDERESLPVGGPDGTPGAHAGRKRDGSPLAVGDSNQFKARGTGSNAVAAASIVPAMILGLNTNTGEAQKRRSHACDGGIVLPGDEENRLLGRAYQGDGRGGRAHDGQDIVRGQVVAQGIGMRRRRRVRLSAAECRSYPGKKHTKE